MARQLAERIASEPPDLIIHSGLRRAWEFASVAAQRSGSALREDPRWRERDFGTWEGRTWHSIWRETGSAMDRMFSDPASFRPGGGETTLELAQRALAAWNDLPSVAFTVVITHGGPIAALRWQLANRETDLASLIPKTGEVIDVRR